MTRAGWRVVSGAVRRECNAKNRFGHVDRDRRGGRNLRNLSAGRLVVRLEFSHGLGRYRILGQKFDLGVVPRTL